MRFLKRAAARLPVLLVPLAVLAFCAVRPAAAQTVGNEICLECHGRPGMQTILPSGETLYLTVDPQVYAASVHGQVNQACTDCHVDNRGYPHPPLTVRTRRELSSQLYRTACVNCHPDKYKATLDSVHQTALAGGQSEAAICTDCHGTHNIQKADEPHSRGSQMCEICHSQIFELYKSSVHGAALIGEGNRDVPGCVDCHEVHSVQGPSTAGSFHPFSPQLCAECHADTNLMERYGISTEVFDTYLADFHGTTVMLFEKQSPDQETNKPVCIDCHGVHSMKQADDPESAVIKQNLLVTCQRCHPGATADFPTSWVGHFRPDPQHAPLVYFIKIFYWILLPGALGVMVLFVVTDAGRRVRNRFMESRHG